MKMCESGPWRQGKREYAGDPRVALSWASGAGLPRFSKGVLAWLDLNINVLRSQNVDMQPANC